MRKSDCAIICWLIFAMITIAFEGMVNPSVTLASNNETIKELINQYDHTSNDAIRINILQKISDTQPMSQEDMKQLRKIFLRKEFDINLFAAAAFGAIQKVRDQALDKELIGILKDEKPLMQKIFTKSEIHSDSKEVAFRSQNVTFIIEKLGYLKSQNAIPALKEYLPLYDLQLTAIDALLRIGAELSLDEIDVLIRNLQDESKKDEWKLLSKELILIKNPHAKPDIRKLIDHKDVWVRTNAVKAFCRMVDRNNADDIAVLAKHSDLCH